jgi:hypothetical protein
MDKELPIIFFHVLAKDKGKVIDYWLEQNLDKIDYPKDRIRLWFRTNNNNDETLGKIESWIDDQRIHDVNWYSIDLEDDDVPEQVQRFDVHEWNPERFKVLGKLRQDGIQMANDLDADFYFVCDVDNFLLPHTLRTLVSYNLPVVAPLLRYAVTKDEYSHRPYSNFHYLANDNGYFLDEINYYRVLNGEIRGLIKCDVVHCTYLIRQDVLPLVKYVDESDKYEYVIFSDTLRSAGVPQFLDNQEVYGYLTLKENVEACKHWMELLANVRKTK